MKTKLSFITAVLALCLASCEPATHEDWQKYHDKECATRITKFNYEGHSYLLYRHNKSESIAHDANCQCYNISGSDY